jgi:hypothetical protein
MGNNCTRCDAAGQACAIHAVKWTLGSAPECVTWSDYMDAVESWTAQIEALETDLEWTRAARDRALEAVRDRADMLEASERARTQLRNALKQIQGVALDTSQHTFMKLANAALWGDDT